MKRVKEENINTPEYWDAQWQDRPPEVEERFRFVAGLLRAAKVHTLLDIGCGDGNGYNVMRGTLGEALYTGTDFSAVAIAKAKRDYPEAMWAEADCAHQPFDDLSFDAVICQETLEHVEEPQALLDECKRLARDTIIITTPLENAITSAEHIWAFTKRDIEWGLGEGWTTSFATFRSGLIIAVAHRTKP